jgi:hypothetical protein
MRVSHVVHTGGIAFRPAQPPFRMPWLLTHHGRPCAARLADGQKLLDMNNRCHSLQVAIEWVECILQDEAEQRLAANDLDYDAICVDCGTSPTTPMPVS